MAKGCTVMMEGVVPETSPTVVLTGLHYLDIS